MSAVRVFDGVDGLEAEVGTTLGVSDWVAVDQDRVNGFADATGDHQWIHVDVARAGEGPFGGTIAHGYLTLSMVPVFLADVYRVEGLSAVLNYGLDKVRFPQPVPVGSRVRGRIDLVATHPAAQGVLATLVVTVEIEGEERPGCVAQVVHLLVPAAE